MRPSVSINIKVIDNEKAKTVAHIGITPTGDSDLDGFGDYKYRVQEPGGAILEGEIKNFHEDRGVLTLMGLVVSASGHYGEIVQMPASEIAKLLGHEKMEEISDRLDRRGE
jgi:hypothetical protein